MILLIVTYRSPGVEGAADGGAALPPAAAAASSLRLLMLVAGLPADSSSPRAGSPISTPCSQRARRSGVIAVEDTPIGGARIRCWSRTGC
jgi:hypothetical protein